MIRHTLPYVYAQFQDCRNKGKYISEILRVRVICLACRKKRFFWIRQTLPYALAQFQAAAIKKIVFPKLQQTFSYEVCNCNSVVIKEILFF